MESLEQTIIKAISEAIDTNVTRGNSLSFLGIDNYSKRSQLANALNAKFNVSLSESDLSMIYTVGQLIDYLVPNIERQSNSFTGGLIIESTEQKIIKTISAEINTNVTRGNSYHYLGLDSGKVNQLAYALNKKFNLTLNGSDLSFNTIGQLIDFLVPIIDRQSYSEEQSANSGETLSETSSNNNEIKTMEYKKKYEWAIAPDKTKHQYVIGIDFGHGETSAAYCSIGWDSNKGQLSGVKDIDFGSNTKVIPSAISITTDGKAYIGDAAFLPEVLNKAEANVCFKKKPENIDGSAEQLMMRFMKEVYNTIRERNSALFTDGNHLVYIATPSGWDDTAKDLYGQI